jgi:hypothetical protein
MNPDDFSRHSIDGRRPMMTGEALVGIGGAAR